MNSLQIGFKNKRPAAHRAAHHAGVIVPIGRLMPVLRPRAHVRGCMVLKLEADGLGTEEKARTYEGVLNPLSVKCANAAMPN
jgi:hypothetical protein